MPNILTRLQGLGEVMTQYGTHMALSSGVLIVGLLVVRSIGRGLRRTMARKPAVTIFCNIVSLAAIGLMVFLRPFLPTLPFKVGNTIKAADLMGKVEAIRFLNTRLQTFDGKTFFVPNRKILDDIVINY
jgi:small conductance mechanosensitive channel